MLPVVALVGRPNVGKSTLFNTLTGTRDAIVADVPGVTRDRQYGYGRVGPVPYVVIDTGGLVENPVGIEAQMRTQTARAVQEADHLILIADARAGVTPQDYFVAQELRRSGKPVTLAVNKAEDLDADVVSADFYALGIGEPHAISAAHGRGCRALLETVLEGVEVEAGDAPWVGRRRSRDARQGEDKKRVAKDKQPEKLLEAGEKTQVSAETVRTGGIQDSPYPNAIHIAVIGRPNVGKSTLINRLIGDERVIASDMPGTTRDSILVPFQRGGREFVLIDTAGVRRRSKVEDAIERASVAKTLQAIAEAHVVIMVVDAHEGIAEQDASVLGLALERGRALILAVNKWDGIADDQRAEIRRQLALKLDFVPYVPLHFISARHGTGVGEVAQATVQAYDAAMRNMPTPALTRTLEHALTVHQPPLVRGRRIKLRYAHQGGKNPPRIVIHGNQTASVPDAYKRYLSNAFRKAFDLFATPVFIEFRTDANPYQRSKPVQRGTVRDRRKRG